MRAGPTWRRGAAAAALLLLASVLAACTSIPTEGPVRFADTSVGDEEDQFIRVLARPPRVDAGPSEIVDGFLAASASFDDDHAVARSFLTPAASASWRPGAGVRIYDAEAGFRLATFGEDQVRMLALQSAGTISARGQFGQPGPAPRFRANFGLRQIAGQWRIAELAPGLVLSTADIDRAYRTLNLFFLDVAGGVLVPDPIALPAGQPGSATALVRELLRGPTAWLEPAVTTAVPEGTALALDSVPVESGIARVDLDTRAVAATGDQRRALAAQLTYTLAQLADVIGVRITVSGVPFAVPGIGEVSQVDDWESFDPDATPLDPSAYAFDATGLSVVGETLSPVAGFFGGVTGLTAAAVSADGTQLAGARTEGARSVVRLGAPGRDTAAVGFVGRDVTALSYDRLNSVWVADRTGVTSAVWTVRADREPVRVQIDGLATAGAGGVIERLRVSRDGARVVLVASDGSGPGTLLLGRVQRDTGVPIVAGLQRVESELVDVLDVGWADDVTLLVVGRRDAEPVQSFTVGIDGDSLRTSGVVPALRTVAAAPNRPFLAGTASRTLWIDRGNGWRAYLPGGTPVYPG